MYVEDIIAGFALTRGESYDSQFEISDQTETAQDQKCNNNRMHIWGNKRVYNNKQHRKYLDSS